MKKFFLLILLIVIGCGHQSVAIMQGDHGYVGSLSHDYDVFQLDAVEGTATSFLGITNGDDTNTGGIVNFFGIEKKSKMSNMVQNLICVVNLVSSSIVVGTAVSDPNSELRIHPVGMLLGLGLAGLVNETVFSNSTQVNASIMASRQLIQNNPNMDVFIYPKYFIEYRSFGLGSESMVRIISKAAKLKDGLFSKTDSLLNIGEVIDMNPSLQKKEFIPLTQKLKSKSKEILIDSRIINKDR
tara:strand:- start:573 stop:1295 length:723 start_codon:yes stop_codon:yes gene_type:complete